VKTARQQAGRNAEDEVAAHLRSQSVAIEHGPVDKVGARSAYAAQQLARAGVADVRNLAGGILRWIDDVDPTMPRY